MSWQWAVVKVKLDGMLGEGTGASQGHLDLPTYATMLPGASICVCDSGNARLQTFTPTGRVKGVFSMRKGVKNWSSEHAVQRRLRRAPKAPLRRPLAWQAPKVSRAAWCGRPLCQF